MVSSACGPAATLAAGCCLAGIAIVSGNGGGAVGGGCHAGIRVVGSRSSAGAGPPELDGGGATIVAATSGKPSDWPGFQTGGGDGRRRPCDGRRRRRPVG